MGSYKYRVRRRITILITHIWGLITPLITTHEPPSKQLVYGLPDLLRSTLTLSFGVPYFNTFFLEEPL